MNCIADVVICATGGCMTTQSLHEIDLRESSAFPAPAKKKMER
jgi:hypothetical protein